MHLNWRRENDGVIVVFATLSDGRQYDVADFWLRPMIDKLSVPKQVSEDYQCQFVNLLVSSHNKSVNHDIKSALPKGDER